MIPRTLYVVQGTPYNVQRIVYSDHIRHTVYNRHTVKRRIFYKWHQTKGGMIYCCKSYLVVRWYGVRRTTCDVRYTKHDMPCIICEVRYAMYDIRRTACGIRRVTYCMRGTICGVRRATYGVLPATLDVHRTSYVVHTY